MNKRKSEYPPNEGWVRMTLKMASKTPESVDEIKRLATFDKAEEYDFGPIEQYGATINVVLRHHSRRPASAAPEPQTCPRCEGVGSLLRSEEAEEISICPACKGTGRTAAEPANPRT